MTRAHACLASARRMSEAFKDYTGGAPAVREAGQQWASVARRFCMGELSEGHLAQAELAVLIADRKGAKAAVDKPASELAGW